MQASGPQLQATGLHETLAVANTADAYMLPMPGTQRCQLCVPGMVPGRARRCQLLRSIQLY